MERDLNKRRSSVEDVLGAEEGRPNKPIAEAAAAAAQHIRLTDTPLAQLPAGEDRRQDRDRPLLWGECWCLLDALQVQPEVFTVIAKQVSLFSVCLHFQRHAQLSGLQPWQT